MRVRVSAAHHTGWVVCGGVGDSDDNIISAAEGRSKHDVVIQCSDSSRRDSGVESMGRGMS